MDCAVCKFAVLSMLQLRLGLAGPPIFMQFFGPSVRVVSDVFT